MTDRYRPTDTAGCRARRLDSPLLTLMLGATVAAWLLLRPAPLLALPMVWRLPLIVIGAWALGAAFLRPLALEAGETGLWRLAGAPFSRWSLWGVASVLLCLEFWR